LILNRLTKTKKFSNNSLAEEVNKRKILKFN
jgi:hypothetical protein